MKKYLSLIKFSHTIFALPFAMLGFCLGTLVMGKGLDPFLLLKVILCMVFARSAAMAFNRYVDRDIDALNPRTALREIPAGFIKERSALFFILINSLAFIGTTWFINPLCFWLSPVALAIICGYSLTKRYTALCHLILGIGLSLSPIGAYLAVTGYFHPLPVFYSLAIIFWVAGFDIIYALQDEEFDNEHGLSSIPARFGKKNALRISVFFHVLTVIFSTLAAYQLPELFPWVGMLQWSALFIFSALLVYQHSLVSPKDLSRVNLAFFTTNGVASIIFCGLIILDLLV
ncbi:MAG: UbiA family prenyltransferase [Saprospiraceae bacterium]|nr:UbiA family prenyltransferase [Saprospiraceae bacterium]